MRMCNPNNRRYFVVLQNSLNHGPMVLARSPQTVFNTSEDIIDSLHGCPVQVWLSSDLQVLEQTEKGHLERLWWQTFNWIIGVCDVCDSAWKKCQLKHSQRSRVRDHFQITTVLSGKMWEDVIYANMWRFCKIGVSQIHPKLDNCNYLNQWFRRSPILRKPNFMKTVWDYQCQATIPSLIFPTHKMEQSCLVQGTKQAVTLSVLVIPWARVPSSSGGVEHGWIMAFQ